MLSQQTFQCCPTNNSALASLFAQMVSEQELGSSEKSVSVSSWAIWGQAGVVMRSSVHRVGLESPRCTPVLCDP